MWRSRRFDERTAPPRFRGDDVSRVLCFYLPLQLHRSPLETWCAAAMGVPPHVLHVKFWPSWQGEGKERLNGSSSNNGATE